MRPALFFFISALSCLSSQPSLAQDKASSTRRSAERGPAAPPNIIFILTDDQRWDALGYAGNKLIHTPEMDKLARQGVYFSKATASTPICSASRATLLSGMRERSHRYSFTTGPIRDEYMAASYPRLLRDAGYYTGFFGKFGVKYKDKGKLFDVYDDYDRGPYPDRRGYFYKTIGRDTVHLTRYTGQQALDFLDKAPKDKPFCLSLSFSAPHAHDPARDQYFWQKETADLFAAATMPPADLREEKYFNRLPKPVRDGFNRTRWYWRYDTPEKYQHSIKGYYRMIAGVDLEIGKIRERLKKRGQDQNTVIIFLGDNGFFLGERQIAGKWLMYDHSIRVPLIIYDPRINRHRNLDALAQNVDVPKTILDIAGVQAPSQWQGLSLYPLVKGSAGTLQRDTILIEHLWEFANIPPSEGVRTKDWKYFRYVNDKSAEELYYLKDDPKEINNLAADPQYKKQLLAMRQKNDELARRFSDGNAAPPTDLAVDWSRTNGQKELTATAVPFHWTIPPYAGRATSYQVLVSSSPEKNAENLGDVWDSGQMRDPSAAGVPGEFANVATKAPSSPRVPLQPGTEYFWKVRIWDRDNRVSDYSPTQRLKIDPQ